VKIFELEQDRAIRQFLRESRHSKDDLRNFFRDHFLHPDLEVEFTNRVLKNVIDVTHPYYMTLSRTKRFHFLKALGKLFDVALWLKLWEYYLSREDADWFWRGVPTYFMTLTGLIEPLETMRREMSSVDTRRVHSKVVLLEGESEHNFISVMQEISSLGNLDFPIHDYKGKGNVQNLVQYIKEKNRQGVKVFLTYDKDGRADTFLNKLKKRRCKLHGTFGFTRDFESSFPPGILKSALETYVKRYRGRHVELEVSVIRKLLKRRKPFVVSFEEEYGLQVNKAKLAVLLGRIMIDIIELHWNDIFNWKKKAFGAEIYRFLKFIVGFG